LKHMFTLKELEVHAPPSPPPLPSPFFANSLAARPQEDPAAMLEIKEDIRDECSKLGQVTNVVLFDREPDGVSSVRFATAEAAKACVRVCNNVRRSIYIYAIPTPFPPLSLPLTRNRMVIY
jgi:hypothetical protein